MYSSLTIANYLLEKGKNNGEEATTLTPMQLIKLVYLCHGWMLGLYGRPLLLENVEVWRYGPVISGLYRSVRVFRSGPVKGSLSNEKGEFGNEEKNVMDQVLEIYGRYSGIQLSRLTHAPGTPWSEMQEAGKEIIPNELIQVHFQELANKNE